MLSRQFVTSYVWTLQNWPIASVHVCVFVFIHVPGLINFVYQEWVPFSVTHWIRTFESHNRFKLLFQQMCSMHWQAISRNKILGLFVHFSLFWHWMLTWWCIEHGCVPTLSTLWTHLLIRCETKKIILTRKILVWIFSTIFVKKGRGYNWPLPSTQCTPRSVLVGQHCGSDPGWWMHARGTSARTCTCNNGERLVAGT